MNTIVAFVSLSISFGSQSAFVSVEGERFLDSDGRQILFHGISLSGLGDETGDDYARLRDWGFNCVRLGINWDGVEPEPGKFDDAYLAEVDRRIEWARHNGIYVFLDMHQDLFGSKFIDGAPAWATLDEGKPHTQGAVVWSDAYFTSQAVQTAFDNFWANRPAPDGVGVQDHYARMWRHIAERYAGNPAVIGYDLMNEPFVGSRVMKAQLLVIAKLAEVLTARDPSNPASGIELMAKWADPEQRYAILKQMDDPDLYGAVVDAPQAVFQEFDKTVLMPFYQRVANAIREVDRNHVLFLETTVAANVGVYSAIEPVLAVPLSGANPSLDVPDPLQAYAPHGYDLVTDTPGVGSPCNTRVELIFRRHAETAKRLGMPMLVGEWGAYGMTPRALPAAEFAVRQFETLLCGETYWRIGKDMTRADVWPAIQRAVPVEVAGALLEYRAEISEGTFTCAWKEDPNVFSPSRVYLPERFECVRGRVAVSPDGNGFAIEPVREGSRNTYVVIPTCGAATERRLTVAPR